MPSSIERTSSLAVAPGQGRRHYSTSWLISSPTKTDCWSLKTQQKSTSGNQPLAFGGPAGSRDKRPPPSPSAICSKQACATGPNAQSWERYAEKKRLTSYKHSTPATAEVFLP